MDLGIFRACLDRILFPSLMISIKVKPLLPVLTVWICPLSENSGSLARHFPNLDVQRPDVSSLLIGRINHPRQNWIYVFPGEERWWTSLSLTRSSSTRETLILEIFHQKIKDNLARSTSITTWSHRSGPTWTSQVSGSYQLEELLEIFSNSRIGILL